MREEAAARGDGILREGVNAPIDVHTGGRCRAIRKDLAARRAGKDDFIG